MNRRLIGFMMWPLMLPGCAQMGVQSSYATSRDHCQQQAESRFPPSSMGADNQQKAQLVQAFNGCMQQAGWDMGSPAKAEDDALRKHKRQMLAPPSRGVFPYEEY